MIRITARRFRITIFFVNIYYRAISLTASLVVSSYLASCKLSVECSVLDQSCSPPAWLLSGGRTPLIAATAADGRHSLYVSANGKVRAWGNGILGQLGYNGTADVGDTQATSIISMGDIAIGGSAIYAAAGSTHSCVVLSTGSVRCWGEGTNGRLGYNSTANIGDTVSSSILLAGDVPLGGNAVQVSCGFGFSCALLDNGAVRCWGYGNSGRLGTNAGTDVGDTPATSIINTGDTPIGGTVTQISAGLNHACALLANGAVRCWGTGSNGQLGYNATANVGDSLATSILNAGDVPVGGTVKQIAAGRLHTCALLTTGTLRCWGDNPSGQLGYNTTTAVGTSVGNSIILTGDVPVGDTVLQVAGGDFHTCALLSTGAVRCWGDNAIGQLGYNNTANVGNAPANSIINAGDVPLGGRAISITAGEGYTCALLTTGSVRCWGSGTNGRLGYNSTANVGDSPSTSIQTAGDVPLR